MEEEDCLDVIETKTKLVDAIRVLPTPSETTESFYEEHASEYFDRTVAADLSHIYKRFFKTLSPNAKVLDLGAGSGRDLKAMRASGFDPIGMDGSAALAKIAQAFSGARCVVKRFEDIDFKNEFDGAWACASLLHLPKHVLPTVLRKLRFALKETASFYISVIQGSGEEALTDGRFFAFYSQAELLSILQQAGYVVQESWISNDSLSQESKTQWINMIARPSAPSRLMMEPAQVT